MAKSESINELVLEVNRNPVTRLAMLHESGERKLDIDKRLKEINERLERLMAQEESTKDEASRQNLLSQLSDLENEMFELREGQMRQVKIGMTLSKTISEMVAEMSEDLKSESLL